MTVADRPLTITLPRPHPHQTEELLDTARFKVSCHGRRWGKTLMGLIAVVDGHGPRLDDGQRQWRGAITGANVWWVTKDYGVSEVVWRLLKRALKGCWTSKSEVDKRIELPDCGFGAGAITIKSSERPDSLLSDGLDGVVLDECATYPPEIWSQQVRPMLGDRNGWAWFITTPRGKNWFYDLFLRAESQSGWSAWRSQTTEYTVPVSEQLEARADMGSFAWAQEYGAEFVTATGGLIREEWFRYYETSGGMHRLGERVIDAAKCRRFLTMDLAASVKTSADRTVVSAFDVSPQKDLIHLDCVAVRMQGPDQVPLLRRMCERWRPEEIFIESVGYQLVLIQEARRSGLPVRELHRDKDKIARALPLAARMEGGNVWFLREAPYLRELKDELLGFPEANHDDIVDTLSDGVYVGLMKTPPMMV
jgi:predicted phage terminase large subunit-like protein